LPVDATADRRRNFADLWLLRKRIQEELDLTWDRATPIPEDPREPVHRFVVQNARKEVQAVILYVKASADRTSPHMRASSSSDSLAAEGAAILTELRGDLSRVVGEERALSPGSAGTLADFEPTPELAAE